MLAIEEPERFTPENLYELLIRLGYGDVWDLSQSIIEEMHSEADPDAFDFEDDPEPADAG